MYTAILVHMKIGIKFLKFGYEPWNTTVPCSPSTILHRGQVRANTSAMTTWKYRCSHRCCRCFCVRRECGDFDSEWSVSVSTKGPHIFFWVRKYVPIARPRIVRFTRAIPRSASTASHVLPAKIRLSKSRHATKLWALQNIFAGHYLLAVSQIWPYPRQNPM